MKRNKLIPFSCWPAAWGLKGKTREIAEAEYYYSGEELERRLAEINYRNNELELKKQNLLIDVKYNRKTQLEADEELIKLTIKDQIQQKLELLLLQKNNGKLTENEYDRQRADLLEEPWVGVKTSGFDPERGVNGFSFELDYNEHFVNMLRKNGYRGAASEQLVESWFNDLATSIAFEEGVTQEEIEIFNPSPNATRRVTRLTGGNRDIYS